jgi:N-ethylmaleimide reductase
METTQTKTVFDSLETSNLQLANRIVMAPMTRSRAVGNVPNALMQQYYQQRAGAGLIITEGTAPSADGLGYARTPGIFTPQQIEGWRKITDAVHGQGGKIFIQLMHVGRIAHQANMLPGATIYAPSAIAANGNMWTDSLGMQPLPQPNEMTTVNIKAVISDFVAAASHAIDAGFDGVELHGANGYLLEQFLNPHSNVREDEYGGSIDNRIRFIVELTSAVANAVGKEKVGLRISPYSTFNDMPLYNEISETYSRLARQINELDILYLHLVDYAARASEEGLNLIRSIRNNFANLLILNGGYNLQRAHYALSEEGADLVSFGSPFISNPDLPRRLKEGIPLSQADSSTFYTADANGYVDYPLAQEN